MGTLAYTGASSLHKSDVTLAAGPYDIYFNEYWGKAADRCEVIIYWSKEGVNGSAFARPPPTGLSKHGDLTGPSDKLATVGRVVKQEFEASVEEQRVDVDESERGSEARVDVDESERGTEARVDVDESERGTEARVDEQEQELEVEVGEQEQELEVGVVDGTPELEGAANERAPMGAIDSREFEGTASAGAPGAVDKEELESRVDELEGVAHEKALVGMGTHDERVLNAEVDELVLPMGFNGQPLVADERELEASANELVSEATVDELASGATVNELALQGSVNEELFVGAFSVLASIGRIDDSMAVTEQAGGSGDANLDCRPADGVLVWGARIHCTLHNVSEPRTMMRERDRDCTGGCNASILVQICGHGGLWYENKKAFSITPHARPQRAWPPASNGSPPGQRRKRMESGRKGFDSMFDKLSGLVLRGRFRCEDDDLRRWWRKASCKVTQRIPPPARDSGGDG
ncbi:hypothetical protein DFP72DRAFT_844685 [Ephemerocybe angulata]|uniref:Uncharacterized protein n=1 Tax=Ephemerocybe angulata TaxID=980116 RepID=A0A8H6I4T5_9AGAR|nr:hypothetical protein DFP72DRAFT_844685 [Tulosesus angulatus]